MLILYSPLLIMRSLNPATFLRKVQWGKKNKHLDDQTGFKQTNSLSRLSDPLYLEVRLKLIALVMLLIISHCNGKLYGHSSDIQSVYLDNNFKPLPLFSHPNEFNLGLNVFFFLLFNSFPTKIVKELLLSVQNFMMLWPFQDRFQDILSRIKYKSVDDASMHLQDPLWV